MLSVLVRQSSRSIQGSWPTEHPVCSTVSVLDSVASAEAIISSLHRWFRTEIFVAVMQVTDSRKTLEQHMNNVEQLLGRAEAAEHELLASKTRAAGRGSSADEQVRPYACIGSVPATSPHLPIPLCHWCFYCVKTHSAFVFAQGSQRGNYSRA